MKRTLALVATGLAAALALTGCSSSDTTANTDTTAASSANKETIAVENCGFTVEIQGPAQRVVTTEQGATETVLALGAKDQLAGVGHTKDAYWDKTAEDAKDLPVLSDKIPTAEQIRGVDADLIVSPFSLVYDADTSGTREENAKLGVGAWYTNLECQDPDANAYDTLEKDYEQLGTLLGREEEAKKLIDFQREQVSKAESTGKGQRVAYLYSVYEGAPYVAGNFPITETIGEITNTKNVFSDIEEDWPSISWEAFADKDPEIIMITDLPGRGAPGDKAEEKIAMLKENPATKNMDAVINERFIIVPGVGLSPSARAIEPLQVIGEGLKKF
ncbi:ABC transporter permease [Corynebacterium renale]|uniref:Iron complex transport system substrate-binding protein n=1 Tax=Corynebacterium renale TaxID=1724 RepID=A0A2A9DNB6_9CORY|nr:ABC transporter substrate-binding protein [Corynebacterium renale]PFG27881.1 iron complex transport system substrate-binding protein [Corynebacterium renale]SQG63399.1 ABC transporter permease [Corynebacterium renale]SQI21929.1 ABC transporter permease [Corynebacterium renale]STC99928.1 ABC transporter permease [Corynebacterium renale]